MNEFVALVALAGCLASAVSPAPLGTRLGRGSPGRLDAGGRRRAQYHQARVTLRTLGPTIGFLAALLLVAEGCAQAGLFDAVGASMAAAPGTARGGCWPSCSRRRRSPRRCSASTPRGAAHPGRVRDRRADAHQPTPHVYACAHLANSASLLLPVSNLTNLLALLGGRDLVSAFRRPHGAAVAGGGGRRVGGSHARVRGRPALRARRSRRGATTLRGRALPPSWWRSRWPVSPSARCSASLRRGSRRSPRSSWPCVTGCPRGRWRARYSRAFSSSCSGSGGRRGRRRARAVASDRPGRAALEFAARLLAIAAISAVLANLLNNLPATLVLVPVVGAVGHGAVLAILIGVGVGPNLTYAGSLATLLWRRIVHAHDRTPMRSGVPQARRAGRCPPGWWRRRSACGWLCRWCDEGGDMDRGGHVGDVCDGGGGAVARLGGDQPRARRRPGYTRPWPPVPTWGCSDADPRRHGASALETLSGEEATALLALARERLGREAELVAVRGRLERELIEAARGADLLILARDGRAPDGPKSIGPRARFVLDHAPCPALLVPGTQGPSPRPGTGDPPLPSRRR